MENGALQSLGFALGMAGVFLLTRYVSLFLLFMGLVFVAGLVTSAFGGLFLAIPFEEVFSPWIGAAVGASVWCAAARHGWPSRA